MITVAIVAILAAVAIPSYQDSVWKGKRGEAKAAIFRTLQSEERWYTQKNAYVVYGVGSGGGATAPADSGMANYSGNNTQADRYEIRVESTPLTNPSNTRGSCAENDATKCVRVVARVIGNPDPRCGSFLSMDTAGVKQSDVANNVCWN